MFAVLLVIKPHRKYGERENDKNVIPFGRFGMDVIEKTSCATSQHFILTSHKTSS